MNKEIQKMIDEGWCYDCTCDLKACIRNDKCMGCTEVENGKDVV